LGVNRDKTQVTSQEGQYGLIESTNG